MAFVIDLGFVTEHARDDFVERALPKVRGHQAEPRSPGEGDELQRIGVAVTSQSAARDLCHQIVAFLAHNKSGRVHVEWLGTDGKAQAGDITGETPGEAEMLAVRLGAAAKAHMDAEKTGTVQS